jgi:hypothetical protein
MIGGCKMQFFQIIKDIIYFFWGLLVDVGTRQIENQEKLIKKFKDAKTENEEKAVVAEHMVSNSQDFT